ncbi:MAG: MFS transporter [Bacteroidetes bacterium]|nr:MFS transporter [Bacteroidota bacterium]
MIHSLAPVATAKISSYHWLLFGICFFSNVFGGTASTLVSVYLPVITKDLLGSTSAEQFNWVSAYINALYFAGWATGGLIWGVLSDKIGRAKSLAAAVAMYGVLTLLKGLVTSWEILLVMQFFCGFGVGGVLVINTTLLSEVWPAKSRSVFIGFVSVGFAIGIFSSGTINYFISEWRQGLLFGACPLILGVSSFFLLHESEEWKNTHQTKHTRITGNIREMISGSVIFGSMLVGLWAIFSWLPTWVQSLLLTTDGQKERGISLMLLGMGGLSGGFLSGWISNALGMRQTLLLCFSGCLILSLLLFQLNTSFTSITIIEIALLAFLFGISQGTLSVYIPLLFPVAVRATATGFCFNIGRFFTTLAIFFVGAWVTRLGGYGNSLSLFSLVFFLGFIFIVFTKSQSKNLTA